MIQDFPHRNKIGPIKKTFLLRPEWRTSVFAQFSWDSQQGKNRAMSGHNKKVLIGQILFLYYEERVVSSNLNSNLLRLCSS